MLNAECSRAGVTISVAAERPLQTIAAAVCLHYFYSIRMEPIRFPNLQLLPFGVILNQEAHAVVYHSLLLWVVERKA